MRHTVTVGSGEPIEIEINGTNQDDEPIEPVVFDCLKKMQARKLSKLVAALNSRSVEATEEIVTFIASSIKSRERKQFLDMTESEDIILDLDDLGGIAVFLMEQYGERPTRPSDALSPGQTQTTATSTDDASGIPDLIQESSTLPTTAMSSTG